MLEIHDRLGIDCFETIDARIVLSHEERGKGRLRTASSDGEEVRIFLKRGKPLIVGELLRSQCGKHIIVEGAEEAVTTARCDECGSFVP